MTNSLRVSFKQLDLEKLTAEKLTAEKLAAETPQYFPDDKDDHVESSKTSPTSGKSYHRSLSRGNGRYRVAPRAETPRMLALQEPGRGSSPARPGRDKRVKIDLEEIPMISRTLESSKIYNYRLLQVLRKVIKTCKKPFPTISEMEREIRNITRWQVSNWFRNNYKQTLIRSAELAKKESPRAQEIRRLIQDNEVILGPIIDRLTAMDNAFKIHVRGQKVKTELCDDINEILNIMISPVTLDTFLHQLNSERFPLEIRKLVRKAFGDIKKDREMRINFLLKWADVDSYRLLKDDVRNNTCDNVVACMPLISHVWAIPGEMREKIRNIPCRDVVRSLFTTCPIYMRLCLNGKPFIYTEFECLFQMKTGYFIRLLTELAKLFSIQVSAEKIASWTEALLLFADFPWERLGDKRLQKLDKEDLYALYDDVRNFQDIKPHLEMLMDPTGQLIVPDIPLGPESLLANMAIPPLMILRCLSISMWGHADRFIRQRFPGLFKVPYWTKNVEGISGNITCNSAGSMTPRGDCFTVTQMKQYAVFYRLDKSNPDCLTVNMNQNLAMIRFSWITTFDMGHITTTLQINDFTISPDTELTAKWDILRSLIDYEDDEDLSNISVVTSPRNTAVELL